ncbi:hypothetical protein ACFL59_08205 [Planctomycetota bacterium]
MWRQEQQRKQEQLAEHQRWWEDFLRRHFGGDRACFTPVNGGGAVEVRDLVREFDVDIAAGPEHLKRQLRALAMRWHPDREGGDHETMCRLNRLGELLVQKVTA